MLNANVFCAFLLSRILHMLNTIFRCLHPYPANNRAGIECGVPFGILGGGYPHPHPANSTTGIECGVLFGIIGGGYPHGYPVPVVVDIQLAQLF